MTGRILVVDADEVVGRYVRDSLNEEGWSAEVVHDGEAALDRAVREAPDLVLLDVALPGPDGISVLQRLRSHPVTAGVPVVLLTGARSAADRAAGLSAGADDVVSKPFDTLELVARVRTTLRRTADGRASSPLTGLPGNHRIDVEIAARAASGAAYAVCHVDLDEFKGYNDAYGFQRGDELLLLLAQCLLRAVGEADLPAAFVGHIGGDDFVVICEPAQAEALCARVIEQFDETVTSRYDAADADRGWLEITDRQGVLRRHPIVSVSIGVAADVGGARDHRAVVAAATEMKTLAKATPGSLVAVDRRG